MRTRRIWREPQFDSPRHKWRTFAFLFAFFSLIAAFQARERRQVRAERSATAATLEAAREGLELTAWRDADGVEVAVRSSLTEPVEVVVAVKELAGPWSPTERRLTVGAGARVRVRLEGALGERAYLFSEALPRAVRRQLDGALLLPDPRILACAEVHEGRGAERRGDRVRWSPSERWVVALPPGDWAPGAPLPQDLPPAVAGTVLRAVDASHPLEGPLDGPFLEPLRAFRAGPDGLQPARLRLYAP